MPSGLAGDAVYRELVLAVCASVKPVANDAIDKIKIKRND
jgi:hypothetical protein